MTDVKEQLEKMLNVLVHKVEETEEKIVVHVSAEHVGRAIGPSGSVVRATELILGKAVEVKGVEL